MISGFLITTIILNDLKQGRFSILRFYERRARRILPALFTVVAACVPFAWVWMTPVQMDKFSQSVLATFLFLSNIYFWRDSGYFAAAADEKPLIHTWSLAVEEQFYLLFPLLLLLLWKRGARPGTFWISVLAVASLLFSQWASRFRNFTLEPNAPAPFWKKPPNLLAFRHFQWRICSVTPTKRANVHLAAE